MGCCTYEMGIPPLILVVPYQRMGCGTYEMGIPHLIQAIPYQRMGCCTYEMGNSPSHPSSYLSTATVSHL